MHKVRSASLHKQISNEHSTDITVVQQFQQFSSLTQTNLQRGIDKTGKRQQALSLFVAALSFVLFLSCRGSQKRWGFPKLFREQEQATTCSQLTRSGVLWEQATNSPGLHIRQLLDTCPCEPQGFGRVKTPENVTKISQTCSSMRYAISNCFCQADAAKI